MLTCAKLLSLTCLILWKSSTLFMHVSATPYLSSADLARTVICFCQIDSLLFLSLQKGLSLRNLGDLFY